MESHESFTKKKKKKGKKEKKFKFWLHFRFVNKKSDVRQHFMRFAGYLKVFCVSNTYLTRVFVCLLVCLLMCEHFFLSFFILVIYFYSFIRV